MATYWIMVCEGGVGDENDWFSEFADVQECEGNDHAHAAREFIEDTDFNEMDDGDEIVCIVAEDRAGKNARRVTVSCEVVREYSASDDGKVEVPPDGPNEHFDMDDDEVDPDAPEPRKGMQDDATLSLFG